MCPPGTKQEQEHLVFACDNIICDPSSLETDSGSLGRSHLGEERPSHADVRRSGRVAEVRGVQLDGSDVVAVSVHLRGVSSKSAAVPSISHGRQAEHVELQSYELLLAVHAAGRGVFAALHLLRDPCSPDHGDFQDQTAKTLVGIRPGTTLSWHARCPVGIINYSQNAL